MLKGRTLRSRHGPVLILIKFVCFVVNVVFVLIKGVFIVVKIKCVNSGRISDKVNFTTNTNILQHLTYILSKHT
jgi:hypothetical protein